MASGHSEKIWLKLSATMTFRQFRTALVIRIEQLVDLKIHVTMIVFDEHTNRFCP